MNSVKVKPIWWDSFRITSKQRILNFIIGSRSIGKTYGCKKLLTKNAIEGRGKFIYLRRTREERQSVVNFFGSIQSDEEFKDYAFMQQGRSLMYADRKDDIDDEGTLEWKEIGRMYGLSEERKLRSDEYEEFTGGMFDEWLPENNAGFSKDEVFRFMAILDTVFRDRDYTFYCLGNASVLYNPYFSEYNIEPNIFNEFTMTDTVLVQIVPSTDEWVNYRKQTANGRLMAGTKYEKFSTYNKFQDLDSTFVEKKHKNAKNIAVFTINGEKVGVWYDSEIRFIYFSEDYNNTVKIKYGFSNNDYNMENKHYKDLFKSGVIDKIIEARKVNKIRYTSTKAKGIGISILEKMRIV